MSYTPTNWKSGDVVTSAKLNKLEQGVASAGGVLIVTETNGTLDKTWQEIHDAAPLVWMQGGAAYYPCMAVGNAEEQYFVAFSNLAGGEPEMYAAESTDAYPVLTQLAGGGGQ